jgi:hypothetical protein
MELAHFASGERDAARSERMTNTIMTNGAAQSRFRCVTSVRSKSETLLRVRFGVLGFDFFVIFSSHRRPSRPNRQEKISAFEAKKRYEDNTSPCASHYTRARAAAELCYG